MKKLTKKKNLHFIKEILLILVGYLLFMKYYNLLSVCRHTKIALVGYDCLFPPWVSMALQARGIKVVATQERFIQAFYPNLSLILDVYYVASNQVASKLRSNPNCCIGEIKSIGMVRNDLLERNKIIRSEAIRDCSKKGRYNILVFDYHSIFDWFENKEELLSSWLNNRAFYMDIIKLALEFPQLNFILRGKDINWCRIPFFKDVHSVIKNIPNIEINKDYDRINVSYELAACADLVVAKHTSIGDECLASGIPVLFHDYTPNCPQGVSSVFDYNNYPVFVYSYNELRDRLEQFITDSNYMPDDKFEKLRYDFYGNSADGKVRMRLRDELHALLDKIDNKIEG
jgi:hypothetical protein